MKNLFLILLTLFTGALYSQAPALIPYQAVARDAGGQPLANATITARFTLHDLTATGASVWQELQTVSTSALGLFTAQLGSVSSLTSVNWGNGAKFMQVEINAGNGFVDMGTTQLLSVPYALHSGNLSVHVSAIGDTLFLGEEQYVVIPGISEANNAGGGTTTGTNQHSCGANNVHNPNLTYGTMTDQEGNVYKTIVIGTQEWMAENLNTSIYRNGDAISTNLSDAEWSRGQWLDDFSDNDFTNGSSWQGNAENFTAENGSLELNDLDPLTTQSLLQTSVPITLGENEWRFFIDLGFSGSDNNNARVYFVADGNLQNYTASGSAGVYGYFLQFGEAGSADVIRLYRDNAGSITELGSGTTSISSSFACRVKVTRSMEGNWAVHTDFTGGENFVLEFTATDNTNTITSGNSLGLGCTYTFSNINDFLFDDFYAGITINTQQGAWAYFFNDASYACPYGKLYNWYAVNDSRGLCPVGWHVPSDAEWSTMINFLDPSADGGNHNNNAGIAMKSAGTVEGGNGYWYANDSSAEGTNSSGFSGLPGGYRDSNGGYSDVGSNGAWWSSSQGNAYDAWYRFLSYFPNVGRSYDSTTRYGFSVRCLRD